MGGMAGRGMMGGSGEGMQEGFPNSSMGNQYGPRSMNSQMAGSGYQSNMSQTQSGMNNYPANFPAGRPTMGAPQGNIGGPPGTMVGPQGSMAGPQGPAPYQDGGINRMNNQGDQYGRPSPGIGPGQQGMPPDGASSFPPNQYPGNRPQQNLGNQYMPYGQERY